jgi:hypothetical protein
MARRRGTRIMVLYLTHGGRGLKWSPSRAASRAPTRARARGPWPEIWPRMELCVYPSPSGPQPAGHTEGALCTTPERRRPSPHANGSVGAVIGPAGPGPNLWYEVTGPGFLTRDLRYPQFVTERSTQAKSRLQ